MNEFQNIDSQLTALAAEFEFEASQRRATLARGQLIPVIELKQWRRDWLDRVVPQRKQARALKSVGIKNRIEQFEERVRELEQEFREIASQLEEAEDRGGVLTHEERVARVAKDTGFSRSLTCPTCRAPIPKVTASQCAYCETILKEEKTTSSGWAIDGLDSSKTGGSPLQIGQAALARIEGLKQIYLAQLQLEVDGIGMVLKAGKRRSKEFSAACDDADLRLERIWRKIREVGQKATGQLSDLGANDIEDRVSNTSDKLLDALMDQKSIVMDGVHREARTAWNRAQGGRGNTVHCANCAADLQVADPGSDGEATCAHCGAITRYTAYLDKHTVKILEKVDAQMHVQRSTEEEMHHWKIVCTTDPSATNLEHLASAARAAYDKQLFYIPDADKRKVAVERYVTILMDEVRK